MIASRRPSNTPPPPGATKPAGPGRPKDMGKRAAILEAAKRMFTQHGFDGASMDQIAAEAGVSKLTVYSHFGDKDALFLAAVESHCDLSLPSSLFEPSPDTPLRERLLDIANAFYSMVTAPEAIAGHRMLCSPQMSNSGLPKLFWDAGPMRVQSDFAALLERRIAAGELEIPDVARAAGQFFSLLKGEPHACLVFGGPGPTEEEIQSHLASAVDLFLRAYQVREPASGKPAASGRSRR
ncbi:TetR/AcrR family transcriptional regulator [Lysobacter auxotrophicus]|uniref:TetR/AcrR family transcriptional regulator n=1 Tax=Lysobacter auxotrophicus TaxID=2992573 RepID=A0ABM8DHE9_9GAMM|nr:TetR/AcrR family transcriptional regulator [Lysobacter auxotrophicus]BDU18020.1 TetR/AcrR family transcriptional regulator [Lysobacter auxotrophicus]